MGLRLPVDASLPVSLTFGAHLPAAVSIMYLNIT